MDDTPKLTDHWLKVVLLVLFMAAWLGLSIFVFGGHRISADLIPFDASTVGPNILASFIWLPIAFLGGWIVSEVRNAKNLIRHKEMLGAHEQRMVDHLDNHHLKMAQLLGVTDSDTANALDSTPGNRQLNEVS